MPIDQAELRRSLQQTIPHLRHSRSPLRATVPLAAEPIAAVRVMLVDGQALVRSGFRRLLQGDIDIDVVVEAADDEEAVRVACALDVDVVLLGMTMERGRAVCATAKLRESLPNARILFLSGSAELHWVRRAVQAGANGYVLMRNAGEADLARAIRAIAAGECYFSPEISGLLTTAADSGVADPYDRLTHREKQVLQLIAKGHTAREIARTLGLSTNTVAVHRAKAMNRLGIHKTAGLVMFAIERGIVASD
jgi:DNA-binding NarL/FixJ family response regulator